VTVAVCDVRENNAEKLEFAQTAVESHRISGEVNDSQIVELFASGLVIEGYSVTRLHAEHNAEGSVPSWARRLLSVRGRQVRTHRSTHAGPSDNGQVMKHWS
jgi:hypothetical protein